MLMHETINLMTLIFGRQAMPFVDNYFNESILTVFIEKYPILFSLKIMGELW